MLTDIALISQVVTLGSERAFSLLVERHQEAVRRFLLRLTSGDAMRADDLAQETFIRAWQGLRSLRRLSGFQTWLFSIAYNIFIDDERRAQARATTRESDSDATTNAVRAYEPDADTVLINHDIDLALQRLSEAERTCVVLQCIEGQSIRDISRITGMNENTVKSHLLRGKKTLADFLLHNGYDRAATTM